MDAVNAIKSLLASFLGILVALFTAIGEEKLVDSLEDMIANLESQIGE